MENNNNFSLNLAVDSKQKLFKNTFTPDIQITEDKLKLKLMRFRDSLEAKKNWHSPLGWTLASFISMLTTEKYNDFFGFDGKTIIGASVFFGFVMTVYSVYKNIVNSKKTSVDELIEDIKKQD